MACGPVAAYVRMGMQPAGASHVDVVSRATNDYVEVADPWTGTVGRYPIQQLIASWDTDFGVRKRRIYLAIRPVPHERGPSWLAFVGSPTPRQRPAS